MSRLMAMVILADRAARIPADRLLATLGPARASLLGDGAQAAGERMLLRLDGRIFVIMRIDRPVPDGSIEAAAAQAYWWPEAGQAIRRQAAHLIVAPMASADATAVAESVAMARSLTALLATLVATMPSAIAVHWSASEVLQPASGMAELARETLPLSLWLDVRLVPGTGQAVGIAVRGLDAFVGRDLVMEPTVALPPATLARRAIDIAAYLLNAGPVFQDGDTAGISPTERIRVRFGTWPGLPAPVYRLTLEQADAGRPGAGRR
ncbi:DUF4261 domain-containing protein [Falsiroseomonas ponticola]|uniref:DUF4261 domain-containing protein n=1 Tax=Falsiroseomonas ponticola TaxID=2786951 RepID=UPI00193258EB|nr:DUF4261 domain-containing protein [Roseomonas ponticola]